MHRHPWIRQALIRGALLCFLMATATATAASGHSLSVSASVISKNKCSFTNGGPTALAFGAIDPSSPGNAIATATTTFKCVGADPVATYAISANNGLNGAATPRMQHATNPAEFLPYTLDLPQSASVPKNSTQTLTVTGTITPSGFQNALVGAYSDTIVLTIEP